MCYFLPVDFEQCMPLRGCGLRHLPARRLCGMQASWGPMESCREIGQRKCPLLQCFGYCWIVLYCPSYAFRDKGWVTDWLVARSIWLICGWYRRTSINQNQSYLTTVEVRKIQENTDSVDGVCRKSAMISDLFLWLLLLLCPPEHISQIFTYQYI